MEQTFKYIVFYSYSFDILIVIITFGKIFKYPL
jgi:hypothetical protein